MQKAKEFPVMCLMHVLIIVHRLSKKNYNLSPFPLLKKLIGSYAITVLCLCIPYYQLLNAWTNLYETWYVYPCYCYSSSVNWMGILPFFVRREQQLKNCWTRHFLCGPCLIKGESLGCRCNPLSLLGNSLLNDVPTAMKDCWRRRFLCGQSSMKG